MDKEYKELLYKIKGSELSDELHKKNEELLDTVDGDELYNGWDEVNQ